MSHHRRLSMGGGDMRFPLGDASSDLNSLSSFRHLSESLSSKYRSKTPAKERAAVESQVSFISSRLSIAPSPSIKSQFLLVGTPAGKERIEQLRQNGSVSKLESSESKRPRLSTDIHLETKAYLDRFNLRQQQLQQHQQTRPKLPTGSTQTNKSTTRWDDNSTISFSINPSLLLNDSFDTKSSNDKHVPVLRHLSCESRRQSISVPPLINRSHKSTESEKTQLECSKFGDNRVQNKAVHGLATNHLHSSLVGIDDVLVGQVQSQNSLSQLTHEETYAVDTGEYKKNLAQASSSDKDMVEGAGLRSQILDMSQRIEQLEKEKLELSIAKAPLEARFRQKEELWLKEQSRLENEIECLTSTARDVDAKFRDLQAQYDDAEEEVCRLRLEVRKASSSINKDVQQSTLSIGSSTWQRQLQNDRDVVDLREKLKVAAFDLESANLEKVSLEKELRAVYFEMDGMSRKIEELQVEYNKILQSKSDQSDAAIRLDVLTVEHIAMSAQLNAVCSDLAATKARAEATIEANDARHKKEIEQLQFDLSVLKSRASKVIDRKIFNKDDEDEAVLKARIEERDRRIKELEDEVLRGEEVRRQLHNRIQELRGNVRVFVRTRPFLPSDQQHNTSAIEVSPDGESLTIMDSRSNAYHSFKFDKAFPPSCGQDNIFQEVADFVQSALDGYQVCLFSYGQTGSGKTHTMQGSGNGPMRGIIPRAVEQILHQAHLMKKQRWDFKVLASFLEIYNEELKDLLTDTAHDKIDTRSSTKLAIKIGSGGKNYVEGLVEKSIETGDFQQGIHQLEELMSVASRARSVASTNMNAHSSRSHSVFMLHIRGFNEETLKEVQGSLNLCDLAGSERLDRSGAGNDAKRLKETQAINKSLSALGDVFTSLAQGASHIPYRNSKLTYLLQNCLSGDGKALMFVNLSPTSLSSSESLCSLRFAQRVNQVELGKPTKNIR